jgi:hypothetical protein
MTRELALVAVWSCGACLAGVLQAQTVVLRDVDSGLTSPAGNYRWLDVADQAYSAAYRSNYNYTKATVTVTLDASTQPVHGTLVATNLKPFFGYQVKLVGAAGTPTNERVGRAGRYWQEEWNGSQWANGWNLNNKGGGYFPTPNDADYAARRDLAEASSPTGRRYKYTCYLVFDYFITDGEGNAEVAFNLHSSYHVLWKTSQTGRGSQDGPIKRADFDVSPAQHPAYDTDYARKVVGVFGEWERLPTGGIQLRPGRYQCQLVLTEESFHGSGGQYAGGWAAAMAGEVAFTVAPRFAAISLTNGAVRLELADCYVGSTNAVEKNQGLDRPDQWQRVFSFISRAPNTNWLDTLPGEPGGGFYRVVSEVGP